MEGNLAGLVERESAGDIGGSDFTDTVSDAGRRLDSPMLPDGGNAGLHREDGWLSKPCQLHSRTAFVAEQFFHE